MIEIRFLFPFDEGTSSKKQRFILSFQYPDDRIGVEIWLLPFLH